MGWESRGGGWGGGGALVLTVRRANRWSVTLRVRDVWRGRGRDREGSDVQGSVGLWNDLSAACVSVNSGCALPAPKLLTRRGLYFSPHPGGQCCGQGCLSSHWLQ